MLIGIGSGGLWFALFLLTHLLLIHFRPRPNRFRTIRRIFLAALLGHALTVAGVLAAGLAGPGPGLAWAGGAALVSGALVMACLFVLYMPFFFAIGTSLSIQTTILVERAPGGRAPVHALRETFASRQIVAGRLEKMVANGYLLREGDCYRVAPKGRLLAAVFGVLKRAWRLGPGG